MTGITFEDAIRYCSKFENASDIRKDPWRYIECLQGPQMQDYDIAVSMTAINILVFVTGLIGNVLVCVVIVRHPALNSPTDYFLLNLALSDLTLLIFGKFIAGWTGHTVEAAGPFISNIFDKYKKRIGEKYINITGSLVKL